MSQTPGEALDAGQLYIRQLSTTSNASNGGYVGDISPLDEESMSARTQSPANYNPGYMDGTDTYTRRSSISSTSYNNVAVDTASESMSQTPGEALDAGQLYIRQLSTTSNASNGGYVGDISPLDEESMSARTQSPANYNPGYMDGTDAYTRRSSISSTSYNSIRTRRKGFKKMVRSHIRINCVIATLCGLMFGFGFGWYGGMQSNTGNQHDPGAQTDGPNANMQTGNKVEHITSNCSSIGQENHSPRECEPSSKWKISRSNNSVCLKCNIDNKCYTYQDVLEGATPCVRRKSSLTKCCALAEIGREACEKNVCYAETVHNEQYEPICGLPKVPLTCTCYKPSTEIVVVDPPLQECLSIEPCDETLVIEKLKICMNKQCLRKLTHNGTYDKCICHRSSSAESESSLPSCDPTAVDVNDDGRAA